MRLELRAITKRFGSLVANDRIDLVVEPGEIHCLLGENGAGKSTLMNVLYGLYHPDEGEILVDGEVKRLQGPRDAIAAGIGMVHQHFMLVPVFTVAENVVLGDETVTAGFGGPLGWLDRRKARREVREVSERYGLPLDPDARIEDLPVGLQQRVEIVKALVRDAQVLILDEPTAVLTPQEIEELFTVMNTLREAGKSIVFITHKLKEVLAIADRITVIRRGRVVGTATAQMSEQELASMMVGRAVQLVVEKGPGTPGDNAFEVSDLTVLDQHGNRAVDGISFAVRGGEILCIAGVDGNGQSELAQAILGLIPVQAGSITLDGRQLVGGGPRRTLDAGVGFVPEDRSRDGLVAGFTVAENLVLDLYKSKPFAGAFSLDLTAIGKNAEARIAEFDIRPTDPDLPAGTLSGGNQQKVVVAREMSRPLRLLVASQPTRGVDVGAQEFIHKRIVAERDQGRPVVIVSTELDEVLALADKIAVMYRGKIVGVVPPDTSREQIGLLMAGITDSAAAAQRSAAPAGGTAGGTAADHVEPGEGADDGAAGPDRKREGTGS
ncbi:ABC transporter ATP-binding protein [Actinocrinis puniceicyclus]|uniref:ABC transporter ATP-binding protein n=1 Tax=Actinocrinis puniceicyclus TaxID=977794 RepID=A0A8J7WGJ0_9ACTN|nr:ABC transporter ATP-binding protein [Actinocrinis puniceicyclus]MBS2961753.1 ABC transporter ATP-binding protein [Actinocrinis puniceicyclus]